MPLPSVVVPVVSRSHIAVLEYLCDKQARRRPALGHIFAALRSEINCLRATISANAPAWTTPTFEVIPTVPIKCIHGLREAWCAACVRLASSGQSKQGGGRSLRFQGMRRTEVGTHDGDTIGKVSVIRVEAGVWLIGLDDVDDLLTDEKAEEARENKVKEAH